MAIANLVVRIAADIADFEKNIAGVERSLQRTGRNLESIGSRLTRGLTVPIVAAVGVAAKAAIDFESSFAGIVKTVNDATDAMGNLTPVGKQLAQGMRDLSKTIPVNVNELNRIGEAAGQLGIRSGNILDFTAVMAKLGVTTNLSADQAATSLARFANVMDQTAVAAGTFSFDRLGSTIVALGNNFATTEAEIVDFGQRIAGAGKIAGLTESQVLAIGAAMSSVGVQAEAGGTAVQKVLNQMTEAVATNNKQLEQFAATAGLSAKAFADAFRQDAGQAFARFVQGLGQEGDKAFTTLDNLKLGNERVIRAFLSLANAGDLLTDTLRVGGDAWRENTALTKEAEQRFKTTASQFILLKNNMQDVAITLGQAFLPVINDFIKQSKPLVESLAQMAKRFGELPQGIRNVAFAFVGLLASLGPVIFAVSQITQASAGLIAAFRLLIPDVSRSAVAAGNANGVFSGLLGTIGRFAVPLAIATAAFVAITSTVNAFSSSAEEGLIHISGMIPAVGLLTVAVNKLGDAFPRLRGVFDDVVSIVRNSLILAFRETSEAMALVRAEMEIAFAPVLEAFGASWERFARVMTTIVIPVIKNVASQFIVSLPPIQSFLLLLSAVPGFGDMEAALDRVAKRMQALVDEAGNSAGAVRQLGVVFTGGMESAGSWSNTLEGAKKNLTSASSAMVSFGSGVTRNVVTPLTVASGSLEKVADKAKKAAKAIQDAISDSLSGFRLGAFSIPGIEIDLRKLVTIIPPSPPDLSDLILKGFGSSLGALRSLPGIEVPLELLIPPPPPPTFWQKYFGGMVGVANKAIDAVSDAFRTGFDGIGGFLTNFAKQFAEDFIGTMLSFIPGVGRALSQLAAPLVDFFAGLFDRNKGRDAVKAFAESFGGFDALRARLADLGAEGERLWIKLTQGVGRNNPEQAAAAINEVTAALDAFGTEADRAARRMDALGVAVAGINRKAELFATPFRELTEAIKEADGDELDELAAKLAYTAQVGQSEFERLGTFVGAAFAGIVRESGDALGAIQQLGPAFQVLRDGVDQFGLSSTGTIDSLLQMFGLVNDAVTGPILQSIQATGQIFAGLSDAGYLTSQLFQTVATDIGAAFRDLEAKGGDVATAMALSQPVLQRLWEAQQRFGAVTDETTAKLLKQAEEQGLVGDHMRDVNERILQVLIAIADVFGATLPESFRATSVAAGEAARDIERQFGQLRISPIEIPFEFEYPEFEGVDPRIPALASGGIVRRPTLALVGEAGPEAVVPLSQLGSVSGPEAATSTVILEADGRTLAEITVPHIPGVVQRYGLVP